MVALTTATKVKDRLVTMQGYATPTGLTDPRIEDVVTGVSGLILHRLGLTAAPAAGVLLDAITEACVELCVIKIRMEYYATDGEAISALDTRWRHVLGDLPEVESVANAERSAAAASNITPTRRAIRFTDAEVKVSLE